MADAPAFDWVCSELEQQTTLDRLEARGTIRIALKEAGLDARSATARQLAVVVEKVLPAQLQSRGVEAGDELIASLASALAEVPDEGGAESPDAVFARLGG